MNLRVMASCGCAAAHATDGTTWLLGVGGGLRVYGPGHILQSSLPPWSSVPCFTRTLPPKNVYLNDFLNYRYPISKFLNEFWRITPYLLYLCELHDSTRLGRLSLANYFYCRYQI